MALREGSELSKRRKCNLSVVTDEIYTDSSLDNSNFGRVSIEYKDIHLKKNGDILFSDAYPVVSLKDLRFGENLGSGVQGTVFKCEHIPSGKEMAVKSIKITDKSQLQKSVDEIHSMRKIKHPNVVSLFSAFAQKGMIHILMDLVVGASLGDYIKFIPVIPEPALIELTRQLLKGLQFIRQNYIIHRDLKPSNIMVSLNGEIKIADFGLAKQLTDTTDLTSTMTGAMFYMSPERVRGKLYGFKSDVWGVGLILYQCFIGTFPFGGSNPQIWNVTFEKQSDIVINIGEGKESKIADFLGRCLVIEPSQRATYEELMEHEWIKGIDEEKGRAALIEWVTLANEKRDIDLEAKRRSQEALKMMKK